MKNNSFFTKALAIVAVLLFTTAATASAQCEFTVTDLRPYVEDFEGDGFDCWTVETTTGGSWSTLTGSESTVAYFSYSNAGDEARLISPVLDISSVDEAMLSFSYGMFGGDQPDELTVCYRSSETDEWHVLNTYSFSDWANYYEDSFLLPDLSATYQISFLGWGAGGGLFIVVDNIEVASTASCPRPVNLHAANVGATSALLSWSTTGEEEGWIVELNGVEREVETQPYLADDLMPGTAYTLRVKAICGDDNESGWAVPITFTTTCEEVVVTDEQPYTEDFEEADVLVCWENELIAGTLGWEVDIDDSGNHAAHFYWLGSQARLISTAMDLTAVTHPTLSFRLRQIQGPLGVDELTVWYRVTTGGQWHLLSIYSDVVAEWEEVTLALPNATADYQIAFMGTSNYSQGIFIDDVQVGASGFVGLAEASALVATVLPNPTRSQVVVEANAADGEVVVYDLFGRQVAAAAVVDGRAELDLSGCAEGVYVARVATAEGSITIKVVKE